VSFNFLCWAAQKFYFWGFASPRRTHKFGQNNCLTYNFLHCEFQISMLSSSKVTFWGGSPPLRTPKFGQNNCLTYNFLHSEFQLFMLSSSKVSFLGGHFGGSSPVRPQNLVKIIVSHTTSCIVSFNFLCRAVQNGPFFGHSLGGVQGYLDILHIPKGAHGRGA